MESMQQITDLALPYLLALAAVGTVAMAIVDTIKGLFSLKKVFHKAALAHWLKSNANVLMNLDPRSMEAVGLVTPETSNELRLQLVREIESQCTSDLAAALIPYVSVNHSEALYTLDTPPFLSKLERVLGAALTRPKQLPWLFLLTTCKSPSLIPEWVQYLDELQSTSKPDGSKSQWAQHVQDEFREDLANRLDSLQITTTYTWGRLNRLSAFLVGFALLFGLLSIEAPELNLATGIMMSLLGGFLAPTAKDLVKALKKARER